MQNFRQAISHTLSALGLGELEESGGAVQCGLNRVVRFYPLMPSVLSAFSKAVKESDPCAVSVYDGRKEVLERSASFVDSEEYRQQVFAAYMNYKADVEIWFRQTQSLADGVIFENEDRLWGIRQVASVILHCNERAFTEEEPLYFPAKTPLYTALAYLKSRPEEAEEDGFDFCLKDSDSFSEREKLVLAVTEEAFAKADEEESVTLEEWKAASRDNTEKSKIVREYVDSPKFTTPEVWEAMEAEFWVAIGEGTSPQAEVGFIVACATIADHAKNQAAQWFAQAAKSFEDDGLMQVLAEQKAYDLPKIREVTLAAMRAQSQFQIEVKKWFEARQEPDKGTGSRLRTGERLQIKAAREFRTPMASPAKDALTALQNHTIWQGEEGGAAIWAQSGESRIRIALDTAGIGPERTILQIARCGPAVAQTFLAMAGLWASRSGGKPRLAYLEVNASDLLRYMGRAEKNSGGYANEDIMAQGRNVHLLSNVSIPKALLQSYTKQKKIVQTLTIGRLFVIDEIEIQQTLDMDGTELQSAVKFRYHLGAEMHEWLCGEHPQFAVISGKLLRYHPKTQKYHILLGFCLAYYDKEHLNADIPGPRKISLPSLLHLAAQDVPKTQVDKFRKLILRALEDLAADEVIPGLKIIEPAASTPSGTLTGRQILERTQVEFPPIALRIKEAKTVQGTLFQ